jgi:hypothetical protein
MRDDAQTFPTLRSWKRMSGRQQDALLDRLEERRRWERIRFRAAVIALCALGIAAVAAAVAVRF